MSHGSRRNNNNFVAKAWKTKTTLVKTTVPFFVDNDAGHGDDGDDCYCVYAKMNNSSSADE